MLLSFSNNPNSPLQGMDRTVSYLVCLGSGNLNVIFEYTKKFINSHPYEALQVCYELMMMIMVMVMTMVTVVVTMMTMMTMIT